MKDDINLEPFVKSGCPHRLGVLEDGRIHTNELTRGGDNLAIHRRKSKTSRPFDLKVRVEHRMLDCDALQGKTHAAFSKRPAMLPWRPLHSAACEQNAWHACSCRWVSCEASAVLLGFHLTPLLQ